MPWKACTTMSERSELVRRHLDGGEPVAGLARAYGVSRKTAHKWIARARAGEDLTEHSRRPHHAPRQTAPALEAAVLAEKAAHPSWGGRKLHHRLRQRGLDPVPAPSTIEKILRRHGWVPQAHAARPLTRFEAAAPHALWQLDFKGWHPLRAGRVHPLTVLDDHSRFLLDVRCLGTQTLATVQPALTALFERYGLPWAILCDHGPPWGTSRAAGLTRFEVWLIQLDIAVLHGRPYHPQTQGKLERLHRTLKAEVFANHTYPDLAAAQRACDRFRTEYNECRPHEALAYAVPVSRFRHSPRALPAQLPDPVYPDGAAIRRVSGRGTIHYHGHVVHVSEGLIGQQVGLVPTAQDGVIRILFHTHTVRQIDLRTPEM